MTAADTATPPSSTRLAVLVLICGTVIVLVAIGIRQSFGLFLEPMSAELGWGREAFAFALAIQNLVWGLAQPFTGAIADRYGSGRVVAASGALYVLGLYLMSQAQTPGDILVSNGFLLGFAMSGCGYPVVLAAISRHVSERRRSLFLGIGSTGGSSGQLVVIPLSQVFISDYGWATALLLMALMATVIVPLAAAMAGKAKPTSAEADQSLPEALAEARGHSGYVLLTTGFFVCGWQIGFITVHFPAYLSDNGLPASVAAAALALIGLFNIFGTFTAGALGMRYRKKHLLAGIYFLRAMVFAVFLIAPVTETNTMIFAAAVGSLWLATVPLTSGMVAQMFGVRYMATLYGIVFLSHQLGSFSGVWLAGRLFDATGSYDAIWWGSIALGLIAAFMHTILDDSKVPRLATG